MIFDIAVDYTGMLHTDDTNLNNICDYCLHFFSFRPPWSIGSTRTWYCNLWWRSSNQELWCQHITCSQKHANEVPLHLYLCYLLIILWNNFRTNQLCDCDTWHTWRALFFLLNGRFMYKNIIHMCFLSESHPPQINAVHSLTSITVWAPSPPIHELGIPCSHISSKYESNVILLHVCNLSFHSSYNIRPLRDAVSGNTATYDLF